MAVVGKTEPNHLPDGSTQLPVAENSLRSSSYRPSSLSSLIVIASDNLLLRKALSQLMLIANIYSPKIQKYQEIRLSAIILILCLATLLPGILEVMNWQKGSTLSSHIYHPFGMI